MSGPLYLEDVTVGTRFTGGPVTLTPEAVKEFAAQFDPQPFHLDEAAGKASFFGGLAASGWHTAALTMRMLVTGGPPFAAGYIGAGADVAWTQPVHAGDTLSVQVEVTDVKPSRSRPERGFVHLRVETRNQRGEIVQVLTTRVLVPRRNVSQ
jgi:acyl dehydratase